MMRMMLDQATNAAFLAAIRNAPDDDAPRLVYADWLDDHDDSERAEFIRVQVKLARTEPVIKAGTVLCADGMPYEAHRTDRPPVGIAPQDRPNDEYERLLEHSDKLLGFHWMAWSPACATAPMNLTEAMRFGVRFDRGFISEVRSPWSDWRDHADAILAEHPVRKVTLTTSPPLPVFIPPHYTSWGLPNGDTVMTANWSVNGRSCAAKVTVNSMEVRTKKQLRHAVQDFRAHIEASCTIEGWLRMEWPGVDVVMPQVVEWETRDRYPNPLYNAADWDTTGDAVPLSRLREFNERQRRLSRPVV